MTAELTTESIIPSDQQQSSPHKTESVKSTTKSSNIDAASTAPTDNSTNVKHQQITSTTDPTTGNIIVANALNHDHIKAKSKYT